MEPQTRPRKPDPPLARLLFPSSSFMDGACDGRLAEDRLNALAQVLKPRLKPLRGPTPQVTHIMAAILIARDSLGARAACRAVPGVPEDAHTRVGKLAERVRPLLASSLSAPDSLLPPLTPPPDPRPWPETLPTAPLGTHLWPELRVCRSVQPSPACGQGVV